MASTSDFVDYFALLSLSPDATDDDVKEAIRDEQRLWVKRTEASDLEVRQGAERRVAQLTEAKRVLLDPAARKRFEAELRARPTPTAASGSSLEDGADLVDTAREHLADGDAIGAVYVAQRATEADPGDAAAWAVLAESKMMLDRADDAVYEFRRAVELDPDDADYHFGLGDAHERRGDWDAALRSYAEASRLDPSDTLARVAIANVHTQAGRPEAAIPLLEQAASEEPDSDVVTYYLALAYYEAIFSSWTLLEDERRMVTSAELAQRSQVLVGKAQALQLDDEGVRDAIAELATATSYALSRHWDRPIGHTIKWGIALFVVFLIFASFSTGMAVLVLAGAGAWIYFGLRPGWKINRDVAAVLGVRDPAR